MSKKKSRLKKHQRDTIEELVTEEDCADTDTSTYVKNVVQALKLGDGEIFLAIRQKGPTLQGRKNSAGGEKHS